MPCFLIDGITYRLPPLSFYLGGIPCERRGGSWETYSLHEWPNILYQCILEVHSSKLKDEFGSTTFPKRKAFHFLPCRGCRSLPLEENLFGLTDMIILLGTASDGGQHNSNRGVTSHNPPDSAYRWIFRPPTSQTRTHHIQSSATSRRKIYLLTPFQ